MKYIHYFVIIRLYSFQSFRWISFSYFTDFVSFRWISFSYFTDFVSFRWISFSYFTDFVSFRWISFSYFTDFVGFCFRFVSFRFFSFRLSVYRYPIWNGNCLKMWKLGNLNTPVSHTRFVDPLFENFAYIKKNHIFSLLKTVPYTRKYYFFRHCTKSTLISVVFCIK